MPHFIYLLRKVQFVMTGEHIYKLGKSRQEGFARVNSYEAGFELLLQVQVENEDIAETELLAKFKKLFVFHTALGNETFEGDPKLMVAEIMKYSYSPQYVEPAMPPVPRIRKTVRKLRTPKINAYPEQIPLSLAFPVLGFKSDARMDATITRIMNRAEKIQIIDDSTHSPGECWIECRAEMREEMYQQITESCVGGIVADYCHSDDVIEWNYVMDFVQNVFYEIYCD